MAIGYSEQQRIQSHLQGKNNSCPLCSTNSWGIAEDLIVAPFFDREYKRVIEGKVFPMVALICNDCGYVRQIAAAKMGLIS